MNISATIAIYGGGPGSGCNPEAGKCGRPSLGKTSTPSSGLQANLLASAEDLVSRKLAQGIASTIDKAGGMDDRLYQRFPLKYIHQDRERTSGLNAAAAYSSSEQGIFVGDMSNKKDKSGRKADATPTEIAVHEYGHHIYNNWLATTEERTALKNPNALSTRGSDWNAKTADADVAAMKDEYAKQADIVNNTFGIPKEFAFLTGPDRNASTSKAINAVWSGLQALHLDTPGLRGIQNPNEWFAEGFREYMTGHKDYLEKTTPATYHLIDTLVHGGYFNSGAS